MTTQRQGKPYIYVTWLTGVLSSDKECGWAPWFKAHFRYDKRPDSSFDLAAWTANHMALVNRRRAELEEAGFAVTCESENDFRWHGKTAILAGKPDIVAIRGIDVLVVDCKTGKQRHSDWWQVLIYLVALPHVRRDLPDGAVLRGEVVYGDHTIGVAPEELTQERRDAIYARLRDTGGEDRPKRMPSRHECNFCDIADADCPDRFVDETEAPASVSAEF